MAAVETVGHGGEPRGGVVVGEIADLEVDAPVAGIDDTHGHRDRVGALEGELEAGIDLGPDGNLCFAILSCAAHLQTEAPRGIDIEAPAGGVVAAEALRGDRPQPPFGRKRPEHDRGFEGEVVGREGARLRLGARRAAGDRQQGVGAGRVDRGGEPLALRHRLGERDGEGGGVGVEPAPLEPEKIRAGLDRLR